MAIFPRTTSQPPWARGAAALAAISTARVSHEAGQRHARDRVRPARRQMKRFLSVGALRAHKRRKFDICSIPGGFTARGVNRFTPIPVAWQSCLPVERVPPRMDCALYGRRCLRTAHAARTQRARSDSHTPQGQKFAQDRGALILKKIIMPTLMLLDRSLTIHFGLQSSVPVLP